MKFKISAEKAIEVYQKIIDGEEIRKQEIIDFEVKLFYGSMILMSEELKSKLSTKFFNKSLLVQEISKEDCIKFLNYEQDFDKEQLFFKTLVHAGVYDRRFSSFSSPKRSRITFHNRLEYLLTKVNNAKSQIKKCQLSIDFGSGMVFVDENDHEFDNL